MSVLVYIENTDGGVKKNVIEAVSYAIAYGAAVDQPVVGVSIGNVTDEELKKAGTVGLSKIIKIDGYDYINHQIASSVLADIANTLASSTVIMSSSNQGKGAAPRLAIKLSAGIITDVIDAPSSATPVVVKRKGFSGKAILNVALLNDKNVITVAVNSFGVKEANTNCSIESGVSSSTDASLTHVSFEKDTSKLSLTDAELVVSAGRGLKGAENWGMVDELAEVLGAATACSKPVSDIGWRPHHEHVGQTGIAISPNLYIAIGISGAIQHLAGVSSSKTIVVINTDPEAPFFKAADYGIVGDAFEVVPKLVAAIKAAKG
jgi:electron transfer flavoprotein alpha subunit